MELIVSLKEQLHTCSIPFLFVIMSCSRRNYKILPVQRCKIVVESGYMSYHCSGYYDIEICWYLILYDDLHFGWIVFCSHIRNLWKARQQRLRYYLCNIWISCSQTSIAYDFHERSLCFAQVSSDDWKPPAEEKRNYHLDNEILRDFSEQVAAFHGGTEEMLGNPGSYSLR